MSPLQELYSLALRKAFCKIKDNVKSERVSIMYLTPLFQIIMCLKTHYEKKALFFSFSQMKFFCLKSFCSKNERIRKKNISIQKLTSFLEISIRVSLEYAFKIVKQDTNVKNNIKLKQFIVRNMVNIIKKEKNTILKRFFFDILSFSKNKPLKNVKIHRFSQILIHLRNSKQQFGFSKIHNACIKEKNRKLFHQQIILLAFKTIWKKKKEIFSVMNRNLKYDNLIEINNFNKIKRNHDLSLMRKFALKTLTLCYEHLNRKLKEFAFKRIFILTNAIKKQKTSQNIEININTLKFRLTLEIIQKITLRRISNAFQYFFHLNFFYYCYYGLDV